MRPLRFLLLGLALAAGWHGSGAALPKWDFRHAEDPTSPLKPALRTGPDESGWLALHDCRLEPLDPDLGLPVIVTGTDPYLASPARDFPTGQSLWMELELNSDTGGNAQVFYSHGKEGPAEERSVRFVVPARRWFTARIPLPALGPSTRFRIDPPGTRGICHLRRLSFAPRILLDTPDWPTPAPPALGAASPRLRSGNLELIHGDRLGDFEIRINDSTFAIGPNRPLLGYLTATGVRWWKLTEPATLTQSGSRLSSTTRAHDPEGAAWVIIQSFQPSALTGGLEVETRVTVSQDRSVVFLPLFGLHPGVGTFGTNKVQALLAGVEYLENEESSSERDLIGAQARRQVVDTLKLTFPLMSLAADGRWIGLMWESSPHFAALHDTPDRIFRSGGSVLSVIFPGSDPALREDGNLLPYDGELLKANQPLVLRATLMGGRGNSVVPSVQEFVSRRGLPPLPKPELDARSYYRLAAKGWLDSDLRDGPRFRHAVGPTFNSQPAADAALYMDWLADRVQDPTLAGRLRQQAVASLEVVPLPSRIGAQVGHVRYPAPPLVYGGATENAAAALADGQSLLARFQSDGSLPYRATPGNPDYSSTHWSDEANGLAGTLVAGVLERGIFSGDQNLILEGLRLLRALDRFRDSVPRGAQTWEVPLHTPDILASAYLVRAYTLGYELTGIEDFLVQARYWAWTGVPFIYLTAPTDQPVGVYSTTPVLGATQWVAPNWIGLPVQWCGLVYADAIRRLARHDPTGPWIQLCDGIALAGVQQTHTDAEPDKQGLLPDSFDLRSQFRNPVPINPATLLPLALQAYGEPAVYDFRSLRRQGLLVHAPGPLNGVVERSDGVNFRVEGWPNRPWHVVVNGLTKKPRVKLNGEETLLGLPHYFDASTGRLTLQLTQPTDIELLTL